MPLKERQEFLLKIFWDDDLRQEFFNSDTSKTFNLNNEDYALLKQLPQKALNQKAKGLQRKAKNEKDFWLIDSNYFPIEES